MQSWWLAAISRSSWASPLQIRKRLNPWPLYTSSTTSGAGNPAIRSEDPQGEDADEAATALLRGPIKEISTQSPSLPKRHTPFASSPKLENSSLISPPPLEYPSLQQKRHNHGAPVTAIEEASCVGWDGGPVADEYWWEEEKDDYKPYYNEHRPSPISEIEIADTRKPINRATDSAVGGEEYEYGSWRPGEVGVWLPEQLDTAEEALLRAEAMFRAMKERGEPDSPQAKVLARLRGEAL